MVRVAEKIRDILDEFGIGYVFGIPGGHTAALYDALSGSKGTRPILTRHEQEASIMADMYGRLTGKPGVVCGQGPFMASSAAFGIMESYTTSSPMLVLTDVSDYSCFAQHGIMQLGLGEYGGVDLFAILKTMTKYVTLATSPLEAVHGVQLAIKHAITGRPGPAAVLFRHKAIDGEVGQEMPLKIYSTKKFLEIPGQAAWVEDVEKAVDLLLVGDRPAIIAGNGVHASRAYDELRELAELLSIPVATSIVGKSTFPETHPLAVGNIGYFGQRIANRVVREADVLLVVGCRLTAQETCFEAPDFIDGDRQNIIQIDIDSRNIGWIFPVQVGMVGDAKIVLNQMLGIVRKRLQGIAAKKAARLEELGNLKEETGYFDHPKMYDESVPILPQRFVRELGDVIDERTVIAVDVGNNRHWLNHYLKTKAVRTYFVTGGTCGIGWGAPAILTAKLLYPDRPCIGVTGDGGFGATGLNALLTAIKYDIAAVWVIMNDSGFGMVRDFGVKCWELAVTDFARMAESLGCKGFKIERPQNIRPAIEEALTCGEPAVVDVHTSRKENLYTQIGTPTFLERLKKL